MATAKYFNPTTNQWEELSVSRLETPRNINGVPFDGSQDITIPTGGGGTSDYADLTNKPQINGVELSSNKTSANLGLEPAKNTTDSYVQFPITPTLNKFLRDDKSFSEIVAGSGGYAANVYLTNIDSDVSTYKKISYTPEPSETIVDTSSTNATTLIKSYLYDSGVGISTLDAGAWTFSITCKLSLLNGVNSIRAEVYKKTIASGEVILFNSVSNNITNTDYQRLKFETNFGSISVNPTDRIGVKLYFTTTSLSPAILSLKAGGDDASYFNTPIALRHSQLRGLNDDVNVQHLTNAEKTQGALATGNATLATIKRVADAADRLLVDFTVPSDTPSLIFDRDKNGVLFSTLGIKRMSIDFSIKTSRSAVGIYYIGINGITTGYNNSISTVTTGFPMAINAYSLGRLDLSAGFSLVYNTSPILTSLTVSPISSSGVFSYAGINTSEINFIESIILPATSGYVFKSGTNIKIYRND